VSGKTGGIDPRALLLPYQRAWADDASRFKIGLMARQVGKDFSSGEEGIRDCYRAEIEQNKTTWLIAAPSERQSMESLEKWKEWTEAYKLTIADTIEERDGPEALLKSTTIVFPHGSRVIAVPGKPDTVRGFSANLLLTEFAFFEDPDKTWRAILPSITNPLRGGPKKCRLISTPNGIGNKFHELWSQNYRGSAPVTGAAAGVSPTGSGKWSCHRVSIWDAVKQGLNMDPEELRAGLADPEGWAQEYELDFLDTASVLLPYELIALCESVTATEIISPEYWMTRPQFPLFMGIDFGRKRDLTVAWAAENIADLLLTKEVLALEKMPTPDQVEHLRPRIAKAQRVCLDYTGAGTGLGDYLVKEFGEWDPPRDKFGKIELCHFTQALKQDIFPKLKMRFENRKIGIPISRVIREDLHAVHRVTLAGSVTYRAPHTADGHSDRCTAAALMVRAAGYWGAFAYQSVPLARRQPFNPRRAITV
jgi:phage FluMu gp28-like protein